MFQIKVSNVVNEIVRHSLFRKPNKDALYVKLDISMGHYTDKRSYTVRKGLYLLYHCEYGNYINVFSSVTDSPFDSIQSIKEWKHECYHDSCWQDISIFSEVYFDMADTINSVLENDGLTAIAPANMHETNNFIGGLFQWIPVVISKDKNDKNGYRNVVKVVRRSTNGNT